MAVPLAEAPLGKRWAIKRTEFGPTPTLVDATGKKGESWMFGTSNSLMDDPYTRFVSASLAAAQVGAKPDRKKASEFQSEQDYQFYIASQRLWQEKKAKAIALTKSRALGGEKLFLQHMDADGNIHRLRNPKVSPEQIKSLQEQTAKWHSLRHLRTLLPDGTKVSPAAAQAIHMLGPLSLPIFVKWWGDRFGTYVNVKKEHVLLFLRELETGQVNTPASATLKRKLDALELLEGSTYKPPAKKAARILGPKEREARGWTENLKANDIMSRNARAQEKQMHREETAAYWKEAHTNAAYGEALRTKGVVKEAEQKAIFEAMAKNSKYARFAL